MCLKSAVWTRPFRASAIRTPSRDISITITSKTFLHVACLHRVEKDKYGRLLAELEVNDGLEIGQAMLNRGFAHPYSGEKKIPWTDEQLKKIIDAVQSQK